MLVRRVSCTIQGWNYEESVSTINPRSLNGRLQTCNFSRGKCHRVLVSTRYNRITFQCSFIKVLRDSVVAGYDNACINNNRLTKTKRITGTRVDNRRIAWVGYKSALSPTNGEKINLDFFQRSNVHVCTGFPIARKYTFMRLRHQFLYPRIIEHSYDARSSFSFFVKQRYRFFGSIDVRRWEGKMRIKSVRKTDGSEFFSFETGKDF